MAFIAEQHTQNIHFLKAHTTLGRLVSSVDIVVERPEVSKIHALIEWNDNHWTIKDLSSNGTWLNGQKLSRNQAVEIHLGDSIQLASNQGVSFQVQELGVPKDILLPVHQNLNPAIVLDVYNLLPNEESPVASLVYNAPLHHWQLENLVKADASIKLVEDNEVITIGDHDWRLQTSAQVAATAQLAESSSSVTDTHFHFDVSQDEETTKLKLMLNGNSADLKARTHHYVALLLARKRYFDQQQGLNDATQGWVYTDQLAKDLGIDACHLNIQIHRLRKQVSDNLPQISDLDQLIEREAGKLRLGSRHIHIVKGGEVEA